MFLPFCSVNVSIYIISLLLKTWGICDPSKCRFSKTSCIFRLWPFLPQSNPKWYTTGRRGQPRSLFVLSVHVSHPVSCDLRIGTKLWSWMLLHLYGTRLWWHLWKRSLSSRIDYKVTLANNQFSLSCTSRQFHSKRISVRRTPRCGFCGDMRLLRRSNNQRTMLWRTINDSLLKRRRERCGTCV